MRAHQFPPSSSLPTNSFFRAQFGLLAREKKKKLPKAFLPAREGGANYSGSFTKRGSGASQAQMRAHITRTSQRAALPVDDKDGGYRASFAEKTPPLHPLSILPNSPRRHPSPPLFLFCEIPKTPRLLPPSHLFFPQYCLAGGESSWRGKHTELYSLSHTHTHSLFPGERERDKASVCVEHENVDME